MKYENFDGKPVQRHGLHWRMRKVEKVVDALWASHGVEAVMTSGVDRNHGQWSWHYYGCAADFRISNLPGDLANGVLVKEDLQVQLGAPYQVVLHPPQHNTEGELIDTGHIHVEFDPVAFGFDS